MKKIIFIALLFITVKSFAQFPGTDSLRNYNNRWITNSAIQAFTNYRLNTLLNGMIDWIDSARAGEGGTIGVDSIGVLNDSTLRYRKNGTFYSITFKGGAVQHDNGLTGTGFAADPLKVDSAIFKTVADAQRVTDSLVSLLALKLNISDTAAMLSTYTQRQELIDTAAAIRADFPSSGSLQDLDSVLSVGNIDSLTTINFSYGNNGYVNGGNEGGFVQSVSGDNYSGTMMRFYFDSSNLNTPLRGPLPVKLGLGYTDTYISSQPKNAIFYPWSFGEEGTVGARFARSAFEQDFFNTVEYHMFSFKPVDSVSEWRVMTVRNWWDGSNGSTTFRNFQQLFTDFNDNSILNMSAGSFAASADSVAVPVFQFHTASTDGTTGGFSLSTQSNNTSYQWYRDATKTNTNALPTRSTYTPIRSTNSSNASFDIITPNLTSNNGFQITRNSNPVFQTYVGNSGLDVINIGRSYVTGLNPMMNIAKPRPTAQKFMSIADYSGSTVERIIYGIDTAGRFNFGHPSPSNGNYNSDVFGLSQTQLVRIYGTSYFSDTLSQVARASYATNIASTYTDYSHVTWHDLDSVGALIGGGAITQSDLDDTAAAIRADFPSPSGGSPGGSASELQYRVDASTFGGMAGTSVDNTNSLITQRKDNLGITQTLATGLLQSNEQEATSGNQQISPAYWARGKGWETTGSTSQFVRMGWDVLPVQGTTTSGTWRLLHSVNGGSITVPLTYQQSINGLQLNASATTGRIYFTSSTTDSYIHLQNPGNIIMHNGISSRTGGSFLTYPGTTPIDPNTYSAVAHWNSLHTTKPQFAAVYDGTNYTQMGTNSAGDFTITPTGGDVTLASTLKINSVADVTTADSLLAIEDGLVKKKATNELFSDDTYTPTISNGPNVSGSSAEVSQYIRVGNTVICYGRVSVTATATSGSFTISLPIASDLANSTDAHGVANSGNGSSTSGSYSITAATGTDTINISFGNAFAETFSVYYSFTYVVQ